MDIKSYIKNQYELIHYMNDKQNVMLVKGVVDDKKYILKIIKAYDRSIYDLLKENPVSNTPVIYEIMENERVLYVIEEYIEGKTLADYFDNPVYKKGSAEWMIENVLVSLCRILYDLHNMNPPIIHRDIKPDNVIITKEGDIKLLDFNISRKYSGKAARDTVSMGTKEYAAPEQYGFMESDERSDIYSLGVTIKKLLDITGTKSEKLESFVKKATEMDPINRFQNVVEVMSFMKSYGLPEPVISSFRTEKEYDILRNDESKDFIKKISPKLIVFIILISTLLLITLAAFFVEYKTGNKNSDNIALVIGFDMVILIMFGLYALPNNNENKQMKDKATGKLVSLTSSVRNYKGKNVEVLEEELRSMGFSNIKTIPLMDIKLSNFMMYLNKGSTVESLTIGGKENFKTGDVFDSGVKVVITYHSTK